MKIQEVLHHVEVSMRKSGLSEDFIRKISHAAKKEIDDAIQQQNLRSLQSRRRKANVGGRPKVLDGERLQLASDMMKNADMSAKKICNTLGISRATLYKYLKPDGTARNA